MSKEEFEQRWARKSLRETISAVEERVEKLEGSMEDVKEALDGLEDRIANWEEQSRDYVKMSLGSTMDKVNELFNSHRDKLSDRNDALEAMMMALKEETVATTRALSTRIEELEGELALCQAAVGKGVANAALSNEDVPKPKEFVGTRSACDVDNFLWRMENYFRAKGIVEDAVKVNTASMFLTDIALLWWRGRTTDKRHGEIGTWQEFQCELKGQFYPEFAEEEAWAKLQGITQRGTVGEYVQEFKELMLQVSDVTDEEALLAFQKGLKPWVRQEVEQRGVQKLSEAMTVVEAVVKLGLGKDKLGSSKSEERGVSEMDHKEDRVNGNGNHDNGGNGKPRVGKKKPKKKRDKLKCFLCDGPHMLKKCPRKSALKKKPVEKALVLGSSARGVEAKEAESEKKPVECFLCHGPHRLRKCPRKSVIEGNDGTDKEPKKLGSSKGKAEAKRAKRSRRKQVKCFLCRGPHELRNCPKQAGVKRKATSELGESSEGLPPREEVSLSSDLEERVAMKTVKLGPMRLKLSEASELAESSTRLPPMGEVGGASDFKKKEAMHVGQLTRVNAASRTARVKKRRKPRQGSRRKGKAKASRRDRGESTSFGKIASAVQLVPWRSS
ncbi:uncharacterized protein LOC128039297 [Gossypium raimondii]|uniref:uncharacterized protein LOC128039297 n=1 Tax=Gossypium raimondii TaxID=29730 RepID=UPI00227CBD9D|nr:uncharacterized protein LOC128039297 [Gossypium raimondii]